ncbi:MAG: hypothetical protein JWN23_2533 [Rhodocyclales bacterium]|nr:hypothetical protein [Rhodocyclales bacterium]
MDNATARVVRNNTRRELIAFAFVEESYSKTGDIVGGLIPLFAPLLANKANRRFNAEEFARDVQSAYDIPMSPLVAEGLVERLAEAGLLKMEASEPHTYRVVANPPDANVLDEGGVDTLLTDFCAYAEIALGRVELTANHEMLQASFLRRLTTAHFLTFVDRREKNYFKGSTLSLRKVEDDDQDAIQLEQALDVLCAEFALQKIDDGGAEAELLVRLVSGALIAEVVLTLQTPSSADVLRSLTAVLDGPLVLDLLDLSTPELKEYADNLFELIRKAEVHCVVFKHTLEEMRGTLQGPLKALQRGDEPFGPLGNRIRVDSQHAAYARAILDGLEQKLTELNFEIVDADVMAADERVQFCDAPTEESLRNNIGPVMLNLERRIRDARSIATILRLRGKAQSAGAIADTGSIMVTRNDAVASGSQAFLEFRKMIKRDEVPPVITDRRFAGYLWFAVGGSIGALSRKKLIANCTYVMTPRTDVVSKARQYLCELDPKKAEIFVSLMSDQRAQRSLMRSTLGFPSAIRAENAEQLLEEVRLSVGSEVQARADAEKAELLVIHEAKIAAIEKERLSEKQNSEQAILQLQEDFARETQVSAHQMQQRDEKVDALVGRLTDLEEQANYDVDQRIQRAVRRANQAIKALKICFLVCYILLAGSVYWYSPSQHLISTLMATLVVAIAAFWVVPQFIFEKISRPLWTYVFDSYCRDLGVADHTQKYDIRALEGSAVFKSEVGRIE